MPIVGELSRQSSEKYLANRRNYVDELYYLFESGDSNGEVSLKALFDGETEVDAMAYTAIKEMQKKNQQHIGNEAGPDQPVLSDGAQDGFDLKSAALRFIHERCEHLRFFMISGIPSSLFLNR